MNENINVEIAIVGGGLTGSILALALSKFGFNICVIEKIKHHNLQKLNYDSRTTALAASSKKILSFIDIWNDLEDRIGAINEIRVSDGESPLFLHFDRDRLDGDPLGFMIENSYLRKTLFSRLEKEPNIKIISPVSIEDLYITDNRATIILTSGTNIECDLIVAADGKNSFLRNYFKIPTFGWKYNQVAIITNINHQFPHNNIAHERFLEAGPLAILPLKNQNLSSIVWTEKKENANAYLELDEKNFNQELSKKIGSFLGNIETFGERFNYPLKLQMAEKYTSKRLILIGDSAHSIHPIAGQGLNLSIRDISALINILSSAKKYGLDIGTQKVLREFQQLRRSDNLLMALTTDMLNKLFSNNNFSIKLIRDLGLKMTNDSPMLKKKFISHAIGN